MSTKIDDKYIVVDSTTMEPIEPVMLFESYAEASLYATNVEGLTSGFDVIPLKYLMVKNIEMYIKALAAMVRDMGPEG